MLLEKIVNAYNNARNKLIFLDYDGTLANFTPLPEVAVPSMRVLRVLTKLCEMEDVKVVIITGRDSRSIDTFVGHLPVTIVAEHGAAVKILSEWLRYEAVDTSWKAEVERVLEKYVFSCPGSFIEKKHFSLAWHYRMSDSKMGRRKAMELISELDGKIDKNWLGVIDGNKVVEVMANKLNKGAAARKLVLSLEPDFILSIGDDKTDENMFRALNEFKNSFTIKVGPGTTLARYNLGSVNEVVLFLEQL